MHRRFITASVVGLFLATGLACSPNQTPDQLREKTAEATSTLKQDTKAVAEGVREGLASHSRTSIDLNKASKDDLMSLSGLTGQKADRIIAERPYAATHQLVTRHLVSEDEYGQIQDRIVVTR